MVSGNQNPKIITPDATEYGRSARCIPLNEHEHYGRFIKKTLVGKFTPRSSVKVAEEIRHIQRELLAYFAATSAGDEVFASEKEQILAMWPELAGKMSKNAGLRAFMREYGVHSRGFVTFLADVPTALAMLPAYGLMRGVNGAIQPIPVSDPLYRFFGNDAVFSSVRHRCRLAQQALKEAENPLILGAGLLPELWFEGFSLDQMNCRSVMAYDSDPTLYPHLCWLFGERLVSDLSDQPDETGETCIVYANKSIAEVAGDSSEWLKHDFISVLGVASYYRDDLDKFFLKLRSLLAEGGCAIVDFQVMVKELIFDAVVLGWQGKVRLKPFESIDEAVQEVMRRAAEAHLRVTTYTTDGREPSAGVTFWLRALPL